MKNFISRCKSHLKNLRKNDKGFTLVELIVVIVILAILIGVTVAGVTKYIAQSRENTDISNAASIASTLSTLGADEDVYKAAKGGTYSDAAPDHYYFIQWTQKINLADNNVVIESTNIGNKIMDLLPDGLPKSQTGDGFTLMVKWNKSGVASITCVASKNADDITAAFGATDGAKCTGDAVHNLDS